MLSSAFISSVDDFACTSFRSFKLAFFTIAEFSVRTVLTCGFYHAYSLVGGTSSTEQRIIQEGSEEEKVEKVDTAIQEALQNTRERQTGRT